MINIIYINNMIKQKKNILIKKMDESLIKFIDRHVSIIGYIVSSTDNFITVSILHENMSIKCKIDTNETEFNYDKIVHIEGKIKKLVNMEYYIEILKMYYHDEKDELNKIIKMTSTIEKLKKIEKIYRAPIPKNIVNIGMIFLLKDNQQNDVTNMKISFQENCKGNLFIYYLSDTDNIINALEYFTKYRNIDIICIYANKLSTKNIIKISSKQIAKYMINRKASPYIMSICRNTNNEIIEPITTILSNKVVDTIYEFTIFVHDIQISYKQYINTGLKECEKQSNTILNMEFNKIVTMSKKIENKIKIKHKISEIEIKFEKIKTMIVCNIGNIIEEMNKFKNMIIEDLLKEIKN